MTIKTLKNYFKFLKDYLTSITQFNKVTIITFQTIKTFTLKSNLCTTATHETQKSGRS
jgi:hypothetical protein